MNEPSPQLAWIAVAAASCTLAAAALLGALQVTLAPSYPDFIVGNITWRAEAKLQDLIAPPVFIGVFFFGALFVWRQLAEAKRLFGPVRSAELATQFILWSLPSVAAIFAVFLGDRIDAKILVVSATGILFVAAISAYHNARNTDIDPKLLGYGALSIVLISLVPLELALALGRAPTSYVGDVNLGVYINASYAIFGTGFVVGLILAARYPAALPRLLPPLLLIGQICLPLFFISLYPAGLLQPDGVRTQYATTVWLALLIAGLVSFGAADVILRSRKFATHAQADWPRLLSPVALFAVVVILRVGYTAGPHINPDDYHFGEHLLGPWLYAQGAIPYLDYVPPHGFIDDDLSGIVSQIFYDGSAGSLADATRLTFALLALVAFLSVYRFSGSIVLAFVSTFFSGARFAWLFLTPFLCLWFARPLQASTSRWLSVWLLTAPLVVLGVPPQGTVLVAASALMAAYYGWRFVRFPIERAWIEIGAALAALVVAALVTPLAPMLFAAMRYVLENGPINQIAYGVPWALGWNVGEDKGLLFEIVRMSWVAVPLACLAILYGSVRSRDRQMSMALPAIVVLAFALLLMPYSMGRIDPGGVSRPGIVAILGWTVLLPLVVWDQLKSAQRTLLVLLMTSMSAALAFTSVSASPFLWAGSPIVGTGQLKDGREAGLTNIGLADVQTEHWDRLTRLKALLDANLSASETYLDLTSRNAQYFYVNRKPPVPVTAAYNMVAPSEQKRAIERISSDPPPLALLEGSNIIHDGGGLALRSPQLYRFVVDTYVPSFEDGFIIGRKRAALETSPVAVPVKNLTDANWDAGIHRRETALIVADAALLPFLAVGAAVQIGETEVRRIDRVWQEGAAIWLDGPPLDPRLLGYPNKALRIALNGQSLLDYRAALFEKAFAQASLGMIPVAWGKAEGALSDRMSLIRNLGDKAPASHHLEPEGGALKVVGDDPHLVFDISSQKISGSAAGLLRFDFACLGKRAEHQLQIFWWGDGHDTPFEAASVKFTADDGPLIVPLDASPRWLTLKQVKGIRIDLDGASACAGMSVKQVRLYQRR